MKRWHLFYEDIGRSSGVSWTSPEEAAAYGKDRHGVPIECGDPRDECHLAFKRRAAWERDEEDFRQRSWEDWVARGGLDEED